MNYKLLLVVNTTSTDARSAVNHWHPGILAWVIGRSAETFEILSQQVHKWKSFWYVTDGSKVYPRLIESVNHLVSFTYMTREPMPK